MKAKVTSKIQETALLAEIAELLFSDMFQAGLGASSWARCGIAGALDPAVVVSLGRAVKHLESAETLHET